MGTTTERLGRLGKIGAATLGGALLGVALVPTPASAQNLFDFLFGPRPTYDRSVVAYAPDPGINVPRIPEKPRVKRVKLSPVIEHAVTEKVVKKPPPVAGKGPLGPFVNDPTLRAGDVVVTENGLMVYRGGGGSRHAAKDFVGIARAGSVVAGNHAQLASIEKANRIGRSPAATTEVASAEPVKQASAEPPRTRRR